MGWMRGHWAATRAAVACALSKKHCDVRGTCLAPIQVFLSSTAVISVLRFNLLRHVYVTSGVTPMVTPWLRTVYLVCVLLRHAPFIPA